MARNDDVQDAIADEVIDAQELEMEALYSEFPEIRSVDPAAVQQRMASRFQQAENIDELFDALSGNNSKEQVGKTFKFLGVTWQPYLAASEGGQKVIPLAVCEVVNANTGEQEEFVSTGAMVVQFLHRAQKLGLFPFTARIEGKLTRSGQTALNLVRP